MSENFQTGCETYVRRKQSLRSVKTKSQTFEPMKTAT